MAQDYVLLVTSPNTSKLKKDDEGNPPVVDYGELDEADPAVKAALALFKKLDKPTNGGNNGYLQEFAPGDSEGGNGGGGDGSTGAKLLKIRWAHHRKTYWNFRVCQSTTDGDTSKFPPMLRFEACLHFANHTKALEFLNESNGGLTNQQKLAAVFDRVMLVAVSTQA